MRDPDVCCFQPRRVSALLANALLENPLLEVYEQRVGIYWPFVGLSHFRVPNVMTGQEGQLHL